MKALDPEIPAVEMAPKPSVSYNSLTRPHKSDKFGVHFDVKISFGECETPIIKAVAVDFSRAVYLSPFQPKAEDLGILSLKSS